MKTGLSLLLLVIILTAGLFSARAQSAGDPLPTAAGYGTPLAYAPMYLPTPGGPWPDPATLPTWTPSIKPVQFSTTLSRSQVAPAVVVASMRNWSRCH